MSNESVNKAAQLMQDIGDIAVALQNKGRAGCDSRYIGMHEAAVEAVRHYFTALFPYHFGTARERFDPTEKRAWELMRCYDAFARAIRFVVNDQSCADFKAAELIHRLPKILEKQ